MCIFVPFSQAVFSCRYCWVLYIAQLGFAPRLAEPLFTAPLHLFAAYVELQLGKPSSNVYRDTTVGYAANFSLNSFRLSSMISVLYQADSMNHAGSLFDCLCPHCTVNLVPYSLFD